MKKNIVKTALVAACALSMVATAGCGSKANTSSSADGKTSGAITVVSREDGSGTRGAFIELFGVEEKDASGNKTDKTTTDAVIANKTDVMMTNVAGDPQAIGYSSLGSLNDTIKALKVDGVEATADNIKNGSYKISRPFNIVTKDSISDAAKDFESYILSTEGQKVIEDNGYIKGEDNAKAYEKSSAKGKVSVSGSSSVSPVMEKLIEAYEKVNSDVTVELNTSDSSTGITNASAGTSDIGMASRDLKDTETGVTATKIAVDGIAVIVNKNNSFDDISSDNVKKIYTGEIKNWEDIK